MIAGCIPITGKLCRSFLWYFFVHMPNTAVQPSQGDSISTPKVVNIRLSLYCDLIMTACSKLQKTKDRKKFRNRVCYIHTWSPQYANFGNGRSYSPRRKTKAVNHSWFLSAISIVSSSLESKINLLKCTGGHYSDRLLWQLFRRILWKYFIILLKLFNI